jgi:hypothetical protein
MYVLLIVICPFVLFLLAIVLSALFQNTDSDWYLQTLLPKGFNMPSALIQRVLVIFVIDECILILTIIFHSNSPLKIV